MYCIYLVCVCLPGKRRKPEFAWKTVEKKPIKKEKEENEMAGMNRIKKVLVLK